MVVTRASIIFWGTTRKSRRRARRSTIGTETDPEKKLRKLYARAQEIRNLTYERDERRKSKRKKN